MEPVRSISAKGTLLFRSDQRARRGHTLPRSTDLYPGIEKSFAVNVGFSFLRPFDSKHSDDYRDIPIHLDVALLGDGLRRLVVGRLDTRQKLALRGNASVDVDGYKLIGQQLFRRFGVFCFKSPIPCIFSAITRPP